MRISRNIHSIVGTKLTKKLLIGGWRVEKSVLCVKEVESR
jgi:hypothetical protein